MKGILTEIKKIEDLIKEFHKDNEIDPGNVNDQRQTMLLNARQVTGKDRNRIADIKKSANDIAEFSVMEDQILMDLFKLIKDIAWRAEQVIDKNNDQRLLTDYSVMEFCRKVREHINKIKSIAPQAVNGLNTIKQ